jgi:hypothetical protein
MLRDDGSRDNGRIIQILRDGCMEKLAALVEHGLLDDLVRPR